MAIIVSAFRVPGMTRRMVRETPKVLNEWAKAQVTRLKAAYAAGGHQKHGGRRWAPLKTPKFTMLVGSGAMRRNTKAEVRRTRVILTNATPYAHFHQEGTKNLAKRRLLVVTNKDERKLRSMLKIRLERSLI